MQRTFYFGFSQPGTSGRKWQILTFRWKLCRWNSSWIWNHKAVMPEFTFTVWTDFSEMWNSHMKVIFPRTEFLDNCSIKMLRFGEVLSCLLWSSIKHLQILLWSQSHWRTCDGLPAFLMLKGNSQNASSHANCKLAKKKKKQPSCFI